MTRWMLLALLACASAQDVDRLQQATRVLEQSAKESKSPVLAALALKSATASGGSALTKVIKFIDQAYDNIQEQIEKETADNSRCKKLTSESDHELDKLNRENMQHEAAHSKAATAKETAKENMTQHDDQLSADQNTRQEKMNLFTEANNEYDADVASLDAHREEIDNVRQGINDQANSIKSDKNSSPNDLEKAENYLSLVEVFSSIVKRVDEQITETKNDKKETAREYQAYTNQDARNQKRLRSSIAFEEKRHAAAAQTVKSEAEALLATQMKLKEARSLRKDIDSQCVKTTVNVKDRAAQRQAEIDSLKQVKEILSQ